MFGHGSSSFSALVPLFPARERRREMCGRVFKRHLDEREGGGGGTKKPEQKSSTVVNSRSIIGQHSMEDDMFPHTRGSNSQKPTGVQTVQYNMQMWKNTK